ncbi:MAG: PEP/pyruvate-binding domain-containing protein [Anaerolineales bacterium]
MSTNYLIPLPQRRLLSNVGNKARSLNHLLLQGYPVPKTWICSQEAHREYKNGNNQILRILETELQTTLDSSSYAVRSSVRFEDGSKNSYAGQFKTVLDVQGIAGILEAIQLVWESSTDPEVHSHNPTHQADSNEILTSVIIQEMVQPKISGVTFSVNPVTGMDEIIVEAVEGSGEALVQEGITPWRWVYKWGSWLEEPEDAEVDPVLIQQVVQLTKQISSERDCPVDLEWVYDGRTLHLVQVRQVTALDIPLFSNHISREVFPGLIKPLIWSINVPLVNGAWIQLLTELIGPNDIQPADLAKSFFNRAYFNMGTIGRIMERMGFPFNTLELLMGLEIDGTDKPSFKPGSGTFALLPRMGWFALRKIGFGKRVARRSSQDLAHYRALRDLDLTQWSDSRLLTHIREHFQSVQETAYFNVITPLLMQFYNLILDRALTKADIDPRSLKFEYAQGDSFSSDPYRDLQRLSVLYEELGPDQKARLENEGFRSLKDMSNTEDFQSTLDGFVDKFGHLSDSGNDFSAVPWRENPELILEMIRHHQWKNRTGSGKLFSELELSGFQRLRLTLPYRRAHRFQMLREKIGTAYTLGYGLFRNAFLELGNRLQSRGIITAVGDVMFLKWEEVEHATNAPDEADDYQAVIDERKLEIQRSELVQPPSIIYGDEPVIKTAASTNTLSGTPTARGSYTGPARVVRGLEDMDQVNDGDVLVVPYSDISWTPLFAKAGAVVAEAGGILSHSSIIAREYGIPAVVAVADACQLLANAQVTVNGNNGQVILHRTTQNTSDRTGD